MGYTQRRRRRMHDSSKQFGGIYFEEEKLKAKPQLPPNWQKLRFNIYYKGKLHRVEVDQKAVFLLQEP